MRENFVKITGILFILITGCGKSYWRYPGDIQQQSLFYPERTPPGMVLIPAGSIRLGQNDDELLWGNVPESKWSSFDNFWMDETEITNSQYRQFVFWVRDSIIRERLADPAYGGNELYKITENRYGDPVTPYLDWSRPIPWKTGTEEELFAIESIYSTHPVTGEKRLDEKQLNYFYQYYDRLMASRYKKQIEELLNNEQGPSTHSSIIISKDTAYRSNNGRIIRETITRPLSGYYDFLHTYIVNIHPDESCWVTDFEDSRNERYTDSYFYHSAYDQFPVVGVSWEMAMAFCSWRTQWFRQQAHIPAEYAVEPFRLPTEGEWEYAARAGKTANIYPWGNELTVTEKGCFPGNFKPGEGNLTMDGHLITSRVRSYPPNSFGLFDMAGNVAEWTSTDYKAGGIKQSNEVNPQGYTEQLLHKSARKKVIKGGSWKDPLPLVRPDSRTYEYQQQSRSYIGFRCVKSYSGVLRK